VRSICSPNITLGNIWPRPTGHDPGTKKPRDWRG